jgi:hypothetical protein
MQRRHSDANAKEKAGPNGQSPPGQSGLKKKAANKVNTAAISAKIRKNVLGATIRDAV